MTRCGQRATRTALAALALAASVPGMLPSARAGPLAGEEATREAGPADAGHVELQRQLNEFRSELLDERERRIERQLEATGATLVVLAIVIAGGGLWVCTRLRAIAAEARIGATLARAYVPAPEGLLTAAPTSLPPPGQRPGPLRLLGAPGPEADPDTAAPRPQASPRAFPSDGLPGPAGPAVPAPDDDIERHEEAVADCTEAIRLDPRNPRLFLERAGLRSQLDRHEQAIADYDRAIRLDPDLTAAYLGRCHAKSALGLHEQAVEDYDQLVRLDPDSAAAVAEG